MKIPPIWFILASGRHFFPAAHRLDFESFFSMPQKQTPMARRVAMDTEEISTTIPTG
jgi:hypothetical protein